MRNAVRLVSLGLMAATALTPWSAVPAATLNLFLDKPVYHPGEMVTMTLVGDSQGATDISLWAVILRPDASTLYDLKLETFAPPTSDGVPWQIGGTAAPVCGPNPRECWLINMVHASLESPGPGPIGVDRPSSRSRTRC